jgi:hypothetical protein
VSAVKESATACNAFGLEAHGFIGAPGPNIVRKYAEPNPERVGLLENPLNQKRQQGPAMTKTWTADRDPLDVSHALGRRPVADDREADSFRVEVGDEISVAPIGKRGPMLRCVPPSNELIITGESLGRHDEANVIHRSSLKQHGPSPAKEMNENTHSSLNRAGARSIIQPGDLR